MITRHSARFFSLWALSSYELTEGLAHSWRSTGVHCFYGKRQDQYVYNVNFPKSIMDGTIVWEIDRLQQR